MTKKSKDGTLSTKDNADKKNSKAHPKEADVLGKMKKLLGLNKTRFHPHANERMAQRSIIFYEVLQALSNGKYVPERDRFSIDYESWQYTIEGKTTDGKELRIGISFEENVKTGERLLVITVIDLEK